MSMQDLKTTLEREFTFRLNNHQFSDLSRLFFEISKRDGLDPAIVISRLKQNESIEKSGGKARFLAIKKVLIRMRFPLAAARGEIAAGNVFLSELKPPLPSTSHPTANFSPEIIFFEKSARGSYLEKRLREKFPAVPFREINHIWEYPKTHKFVLKDLKRPYIFIVRENWDFIRPCPCTKEHIGCNYWIFNLGSGCPYDCSYCFLQQYTNFPGIVLPANLDDFFAKFTDFHKKTGEKRIRIGTGEFCDSLALDPITGYSKQLVDFFRDKNVYFELKTKSSNIDLILRTEPSTNIVISWSLAPQKMIAQEEINVAALAERIQAAKRIQQHGYSLGFHFDPVVYSPSWENAYREVIELMYRELKPPFRWISIGTLRGTRKLKNAAEQRFPESRIFYGELLLGKDKKLRYPEFLRKKIYRSLCQIIREKDPQTPIYLCMEDAECWQAMDKPLKNSAAVEAYLCSS